MPLKCTVEGNVPMTAEEEAEHLAMQEAMRPTIEAVIASALRRIDLDVDRIVADVVGGRAQEYAQAEADAASFAAADFEGAVPAFVANWAAVMVAQGWTARQAAEDILTNAAAWRAAQAAMRAQRLAAKFSVRASSDAAAVEATMIAWAGFVAQTRAGLGLELAQ